MKVFKSADILIPQNVDLEKWSVVACDQYTSQREYWKEVEKKAGNSPSTLHMIFPEVYLEDDDYKQRIKNINNTMDKYVQEELFKTIENSFIYIERTAPNCKTRKGLIGVVDLESYGYEKNSKTLVRATEGTVLERIPPRVEIRKNASLESPHIMLLIDDQKKEIIEPLANENLECIYDFELMQNGGHIKGFVVRKDLEEKIYQGFSKLFDINEFQKKYKTSSNDVLALAVGDGNHSLATAKACWELEKQNLSDDERKNHPARYALVEIVNLHDESLIFEPIHRVVFDCDVNKLLSLLNNHKGEDNHLIYTVVNGESQEILIDKSYGILPVGALQNILDKYLEENSGKIDYIHGEDVTVKLSKDNNIGFLLPAMDKSDLFKSIIEGGALPRKTFSMGEAFEKRFYLECRKIK